MQGNGHGHRYASQGEPIGHLGSGSQDEVRLKAELPAGDASGSSVVRLDPSASDERVSITVAVQGGRDERGERAG